jgi:hypothetical protein
MANIKGMVQVVPAQVQVGQTVKFRYHNKMRTGVVHALKETCFTVQFPDKSFKSFRYDKI